MKRQHYSRLVVFVLVMSCILFSCTHVTWASTAKIVAYVGEVNIYPPRNVVSGKIISLKQGDKVTVIKGLAVIEYDRINRNCGIGEFYGAIILGAGKTHTVQNALDVSCTPTNEHGISNAFSQAKRGREQKVTLFSVGGKAGDPNANTVWFEKVLRNNGLQRGTLERTK